MMVMVLKYGAGGVSNSDVAGASDCSENVLYSQTLINKRLLNYNKMLDSLTMLLWHLFQHVQHPMRVLNFLRLHADRTLV